MELGQYVQGWITVRECVKARIKESCPEPGSHTVKQSGEIGLRANISIERPIIS